MKEVNTDHFRIIRKSVFGQVLAIDGWTNIYYTQEKYGAPWKAQGTDKKKAYEWYAFLCRKATAERKEKTKFIKKPDPFKGLKNFNLNS